MRHECFWPPSLCLVVLTETAAARAECVVDGEVGLRRGHEVMGLTASRIISKWTAAPDSDCAVVAGARLGLKAHLVHSRRG